MPCADGAVATARRSGTAGMVTAATSHSAGATMLIGQNNLLNQVRVPINTENAALTKSRTMRVARDIRRA